MRLATLATVSLAVALPAAAQGGATKWSVQSTDARLQIGVDAVDANHVYVAGATNGLGPHLGRSSNGGKTFQYAITDPLTTAFFWLDIDMVDTQTGYAAGVGTFGATAAAKTVDGGATWQTIDPHPLSFPFATAWEDVFALDASTVFYVGFFGGFLGESEGVARSDDGGQTWTFRPGGDGTSPRRVHFVDASVGWLASGQFPTENGGTYRGVIEKTTDGGQTWTKQFETSTFYFNSIQFVDAQNGWAAADGASKGTIFRTSNSGQTWVEQPPQGAQGYEIGEVQMLDLLEGWAVGFKAGGFNPVVVFHHTTDGGQNWLVDPFSAPYGPLHLRFVDKSRGFSVGSNNLQVGGVLVYDDAAPAGPPVVAAVTPGSGKPAGFELVDIAGAGFTSTADTQVSFGGIAAPTFTVLSPTSIRAQTPPMAKPGPADVTVANSNGSDTLPIGFLYLPALLLVGPGSIGTTLEARVFGTPGDVALLGISVAPAAVPTIFGTLEIDLGQGFVLGGFPIASPDGQLVVPIDVPQNAALVGLKFFLQALAGTALTNSQSLVISS